jgi:transcriptional regulator with XRE-family HTH domain
VLTEIIRGRRNAELTGRTLRQAAGLSLADLAQEVPVSIATLSRWENGLARPRRANAARYQQLLEEIESEVSRAS